MSEAGKYKVMVRKIQRGISRAAGALKRNKTALLVTGGLMAVNAAKAVGVADTDIQQAAENLDATFTVVFGIMIGITVALVGRRFLQKIG
jgi:hypothetical protein